jgi:hypothetical protein
VKFSLSLSFDGDHYSSTGFVGEFDELNMPAVEENVYINKVPYNIMLKLNKALDAGDKWNNLLGAIHDAKLDGPPLEPGYKHVLENCFKRQQSPTETLLNELGQKGYKIMDLKHWLRLAELNQALNLLEGGDSNTGVISVNPPPYKKSYSYSGKENNCPPVVHQPTTPTEQRGAGKTITLPTSSLKDYTVGGDVEISDGENGAGVGGTIQVGQSAVKTYPEKHTSQSNHRRRRTEGHTSTGSQESSSTAASLSSQSVPEIKHRHNLVTPSSTVPPGSEEYTSGQSSTYSHTAQAQQQQHSVNWCKYSSGLLFVLMAVVVVYLVFLSK